MKSIKFGEYTMKGKPTLYIQSNESGEYSHINATIYLTLNDTRYDGSIGTSYAHFQISISLTFNHICWHDYHLPLSDMFAEAKQLKLYEKYLLGLEKQLESQAATYFSRGLNLWSAIESIFVIGDNNGPVSRAKELCQEMYNLKLNKLIAETKVA